MKEVGRGTASGQRQRKEGGRGKALGQRRRKKGDRKTASSQRQTALPSETKHSACETGSFFLTTMLCHQVTQHKMRQKSL